jgi:O-antigen ligase
VSLLLLVPPALVVALALAQGGFDPSSWVWAGAIAAWASATFVVGARELRLSRQAATWLVSACAVLAWVALSWVWSDRRAQTVLEQRRTVVYVAAALALVMLVRYGREQLVLVLTHAAIVAVIVYALARYLTGTRTFDPFEGRLLAQPLGYANALAALAAMGIVLGTGLTAMVGGRQLRVAVAATVPVLTAALTLTHSRGAVVALGPGLAVVVLCADDAAPYVGAMILVAPGAAVAVIVTALSRLSDGNATPHAHASWIVGGVTIGCAAGTALASSRTRVKGRHLPRPVIAAALVAGAIAAIAATWSTEPRASLWRVAWHQFTSHLVGGTGAGTFALAWARSGLAETRGGALDAHSLYLETLAELGLVGLAVLLVFLVLPLAHRSLRTGTAPVAAGAYVVFLVHAGLDWDWEMPAVVLAGLCCGAAALASGEERTSSITARGRTALALVALSLGVLSIAGARSSSEPGVSGPLVPAVLGARVAVLPVPVPVVFMVLPVLRL